MGGVTQRLPRPRFPVGLWPKTPRPGCRDGASQSPYLASNPCSFAGVCGSPISASCDGFRQRRMCR
jgi:hypothetical protein